MFVHSRLSLSLVFTNSTLIYNTCFNWKKFVGQYTYWNSINIYVILVFSFPFYFALSKLRLYEKSKKSKPRVNKIFKWEKCIHEVLDKHSYIYKSVYFKNHNNLFYFWFHVNTIFLNERTHMRKINKHSL